MNAASLCTFMGAASQIKSTGGASLHKSMGAESYTMGVEKIPVQVKGVMVLHHCECIIPDTTNASHTYSYYVSVHLRDLTCADTQPSRLQSTPHPA